MLKRICDICGKEIDMSNEHAVIEISVRKGGGVLGPETQHDLCNTCMHVLLRKVGEDNEDLGR